MGLTKQSVGLRAADAGAVLRRHSGEERVIALAGNPNVGKSTVFNGLTGMNQHTGNWPGKTVTTAQGYCATAKHRCLLVDLPGTYSLMARSAEEEVARSFLCSGAAEAVVVVCDATCLERGLNLVLQTMELSPRVIVCINLMDEAGRKGIRIDCRQLSYRLGVPVLGLSARKKKSLAALLPLLDAVLDAPAPGQGFQVRYPEPVQQAVAQLLPTAEQLTGGGSERRWLCLRLLEDAALAEKLMAVPGQGEELRQSLAAAQCTLQEAGLTPDSLRDGIAGSLVSAAEALCKGVVTCRRADYAAGDRKLDRILTSRLTGYPIMMLLLAGVLWLTITGANYPSQLLSAGLFRAQEWLTALFTAWGAPAWLHGAVVLGIYRVLAWVVSVMLPPMAIFFPLFTLLEDAGYLPRVAYNLDAPFCRCHACGKQALTMCMGFGCNAAGVVGCRIIDSPRERLLAILTNNFVPCNGRFPTLIALLTMFFVGTAGGTGSSLLSAVLLTALILLGVLVTFGVTRLLSHTVLCGVPSSFTLELPPFRRPQIGRVILRSLCDRTLFVLGRAAAVAAPAGLLIWLLANIKTGQGVSLLGTAAAFLDPFARLLGLDGVILIAFILGFPANEIVVPIIIMAYLAEGSILELGSLEELRQLFVTNGWTPVTALCTMLFSLFHWPCSTTLITIRKETGSPKWTALAAALPTAVGILACMAVAAAARLLS